MKTYTPPPDKSITIRALLLAAIADGATRVENPLDCEDTEAALGCLAALGVKFSREANAITIEGRSLKGLAKPTGTLNAGQSGALARLLAGIMAGQQFPSMITGRGTLAKRPMAGLAGALKNLGVNIKTNGGLLPLELKPGKLKGARIQGVTSAQVKSAVLLAGLYASGPVQVKEKLPTRDHTERLMALMGARIAMKAPLTDLQPGPLTARPVTVPGDISSAAPFIAAALLSGATLKITGCGLNPLRMGFIKALQKMGAVINLTATEAFPEPYGDIEVLPSSLKCRTVRAEEIPSMIDEVPLLAVLAARARGTTDICGIEGLREKESDRIASTLALLASLGVRASYNKGIMKICGARAFAPKAAVDTFNDHRIAMAAAAASVACPGLEIKNPGCVNKSYPGFWLDLEKTFT